jgi:hypothetical protein
VKQADPPEEVFRLGRRPDPWAWPDWAYAEADGTFGNRNDDPQGIYRVLYASTQRVATFVECLAYYRPDIEVVAELQAIVGEEGDEEPPAPGIVPAAWVDQRCAGRATLVGDYADVGCIAGGQRGSPRSFPRARLRGRMRSAGSAPCGVRR